MFKARWGAVTDDGARARPPPRRRLMRLQLAVRSGMLRLRASVGRVRALRGAGGGRWRGGGRAHAAHSSAVEPSAVRGLRGTAPRGRRHGVKLILLLDASVGGTSGGRHLRVVPGEVCVAGRHGSRPGDVARLPAALRLGLGGGRVGGPVGARAPGIARAVSHLASATRRRGRGRGAHASGAHARGGLVGVKGAGRGAGGAGGSAVVASVRLRGRDGERAREVNKTRARDASACQHRPRTPGAARRGEEGGGGARGGERGERGTYQGRALGTASVGQHGRSAHGHALVRGASGATGERGEGDVLAVHGEVLDGGGEARAPGSGGLEERSGVTRASDGIGEATRASRVASGARDARAPETRHETFVPECAASPSGFHASRRRTGAPALVPQPPWLPTGSAHGSAIAAYCVRACIAAEAFVARAKCLPETPPNRPRRGRRRFSSFRASKRPPSGDPTDFRKPRRAARFFSRHITARFFPWY